MVKIFLQSIEWHGFRFIVALPAVADSEEETDTKK